VQSSGRNIFDCGTTTSNRVDTRPKSTSSLCQHVNYATDKLNITDHYSFIHSTFEERERERERKKERGREREREIFRCCWHFELARVAIQKKSRISWPKNVSEKKLRDDIQPNINSPNDNWPKKMHKAQFQRMP